MITSTVQKKIGNVPCLSIQTWLISLPAVTNLFSAGEYIDQISPIPILLIHCTQDSYVSYHHSKLLYEKAKEPKNLWIIEGCKHLQLFTDEQFKHKYQQKLVQFFKLHRLNMK
jgi:fermentation-respiration switch protein FrsA (DUF1100 family)